MPIHPDDAEKIGLTRKGKLPHTIAAGLPEEYSVCGILMHAGIAITPEGLPLGLASAKFWTRSVFKNTEQMKRHINPTETPQDYIGLVARLGGYLARASDPPPGNMIIWRGMNKLFDLKFGFEIAESCG